MLLVVLFVLFTKVMPIFESVYEQLGARLSPVSMAATRLGGMFSGVALAAGVLLAVVAGIIWLLGEAEKDRGSRARGGSFLRERAGLRWQWQTADLLLYWL